MLFGPPGSGKSDLALRLIDSGAHLVADDQVIVGGAHGVLRATAPPPLRGLIEVRGIGILALPAVSDVVVGLAVDLSPDTANARLPSPAPWIVGEMSVARIRVDPFSLSATAKVRVALAALRHGGIQAGALEGVSQASRQSRPAA